MIRAAAIRKNLGRDDGFRWRGMEISRLEGFSDAVFGFALTLLVVSLEVPRNFTELRVLVYELPAFAVCFVILFGIWNGHYTYCRRFGLVEGGAKLLTGLLLFLVLFYVYPLKFLWSFLFGALLVNTGWLPRDVQLELVARVQPMVAETAAPHMMILYSTGYCAVMATFAALYQHALRRATALELDAIEQCLTRGSLRFYCVQVAVALLSIALAAAGHPALAGWCYFLLCPLGFAHGLHVRRSVERLRDARA
jgi:Endosomal/lysosomal potassium channel TMEM175